MFQLVLNVNLWKPLRMAKHGSLDLNAKLEVMSVWSQELIKQQNRNAVWINFFNIVYNIAVCSKSKQTNIIDLCFTSACEIKSSSFHKLSSWLWQTWWEWDLCYQFNGIGTWTTRVIDSIRVCYGDSCFCYECGSLKRVNLIGLKGKQLRDHLI